VTTTHVVGVHWAAGSNQIPCLIRSTPTNTTSIGRLQPMASSERSEVGWTIYTVTTSTAYIEVKSCLWNALPKGGTVGRRYDTYSIAVLPPDMLPQIFQLILPHGFHQKVCCSF
jgi:hypothetical protein